MSDEYSYNERPRSHIETIILKGIACRDGKGVEENPDKALECFRSVSDTSDWAKKELVTTLEKRKSESDWGELFELNQHLSDSEDINATVRLGIAYRDGKGVEKDLDRALECLEEVSEKSDWAKKELIDLLRKRDLASDSKKRFDINKKLAKDGDINATVRLGIAYRDGKGVEKDLDRALECLKEVSEKSDWAKKEFIKTAILSRKPSILNGVDCTTSLPYTSDMPEYNLEVCLKNSLLYVSSFAPKDFFDAYVEYTLYRDGSRCETIKNPKHGIAFKLKTPGIYFVKANITISGKSIPVNSLPVQYGRFKPEKANQNIGLETHHDYYHMNYPYSDYFITVSKKMKNYSYFEKRGFQIKNKKIGDYHLTIVYSGRILKNKSSEYIFSGVGIINDKFVYGDKDLHDKDFDKLSENVGNYSFIRVNRNDVHIETDYFGISKIFYYAGEDIVFSNRYHLLLLSLKHLNISCKLDRNAFLSTVYLKGGMFSEQPTSEDMFAKGTHFIRPSKKIKINKDGIIFEDTSLAVDGLDGDVTEKEYVEHLNDVEIELKSNLEAVLNHDKFEEIVVDITGGYDSRLVLSLISKINTNKIIFVDTAGTKVDEIRCASAVAEKLGFEYNEDYMAYRSVSGGYELPCDGSLSIKEYVDLVSSIDLGTFDSSFMPLTSYKNNVLHLAGWGGEVVTRPFIAKRFFRIGISDYDNPVSLTERFMRSRSPYSIADYNCVGSKFAAYMSIALSRMWDNNQNIAIERLYSDYRFRFHDDFSKECSFSTPAWAPLLSKKGYILNMRTSKKFDSFKLSFDLLNKIDSEISEYEYEGTLPNLERTILLKGKLLAPDESYNTIRGNDDFSNDYKEKRLNSKERTMLFNDTPLKGRNLPHSDLFNFVFSRTENIFNYLNENDICSECEIGINSILSDIKESRDWKALIPIYKKMNSAMMILSIFSDEYDLEKCSFKRHIPLICEPHLDTV